MAEDKTVLQKGLLAPGHTMCSGCGSAIAMNLISRACPKDVIVSSATGCLEVTTTAYPLSAWNVPFIHCAFETASSVASGMEAAIRKMGKKWKVMAIAGDGGTFDIGFQALSGMLERGHKITQVCIDNEAYMNTGVQRSSATPYGASTTTSPAGQFSIGEDRQKKPITEIVAAHKIPYVATASIAYPADLIGKVKKAFEKQPSFVHIHSPCPTGWRFDTSQTVSLAKKAVDTGLWMLYEIEDGRLRITKRLEHKLPAADYLKAQGRFKHLKPEQIETIQNRVNSEWKRMEKIEASGIIY